MQQKCTYPVRLFVVAVLLFVVSTSASAQLIISEFRTFGPGSTATLRDNDEFIEIYNNSLSSHTVAASSGTGYGIAASDGVLRCTILTGTVIPPHGHFLCVNSTGWALTEYPEGNGTLSTGDATFTTDIPANAGIALFNTNIPGNFAVGTRLDAAGSSSEANALYKVGTGYPPVNGTFAIEHSFVRDQCGKGGNPNDFSPCSLGGTLKNTGNNATDFVFVDTNGTSAGAGQRLGAPGPENLSAPGIDPSSIPNTALDTCVAPGSAPNFVRDLTSDPPNNSTDGTLDIRRTFTNNTGSSLTRLRFRIVDLTTFPAAFGTADLRPRTSTSVVVTVDRPPCGSGTSNPTVQGTTLEADSSAPSTGQPNGGGFNSSMSVNSVSLGTPLANGASVDLRFLIGIQQIGNFHLAIVAEGLPKSGGPQNFFVISGNTESTAFVTPTYIKGDFNADSKSDVIWRKSTTGENAMWLMNGVTISSPALLSTVPDTNYKMVGIGDFNGDGKVDVLWWHSVSGQVVIWLMNGTTISTAAFVTTVADTNWKIAGVGDFDNDGKADILWRNSATGQVAVYLMNGTTIASSGLPGTVSDLNYSIVGIGDFNQDGKADVLWRNGATGANVIWLMNGTAISSAAATTTVSNLNYKVVGVGDTNLDGKADVFWWNQATGDVVVWQMNSMTVSSATLITTVSDLNWRVEAVGDFDSDGKADLLWRKITTGEVVVWLMNGLTLKQAANVTTVSDLNWSAVGPK